MEKTADRDFTKGPVWRAVLRMAVPIILAQLANITYSVVDRVYIGHMAGVGDMALTGIGLTVPVITIIGAFANLCGTGGGPLCSIARGEGDIEKAELIMGNAFTLLLAISVLLTAAVGAFLRPILCLFGASDATYAYAADYMRIYLAGTVFSVVALGMNPFINAQGFAGVSMRTVLAGAVVNIALDPIFIFVLRMGIRGAALATVIAQFVSAAWTMAFLLGGRATIRLRLSRMALRGKTVGRLLSLGVTGFIMTSTNALVLIANNVQLQRFGGDLYVEAMTVINSLREVFLMISHGLTTGAQPVLGYNFGARAYDRVKQGIRFLTCACVGFGVFVWLLTVLLPGAMARIFSTDASFAALCVPAIRVYFSGFAMLSVFMAAQYTFVGLGRSKPAVCFSIMRKAVIVVPLIFILPNIGGLGVDGVFLAEPISNFAAALICYPVMYRTVYRKLGNELVAAD